MRIAPVAPAVSRFAERAAALFVGVIGATVVVASAAASPLDVYGGSARASAMGGAMTAEADGVEGLFYNPATLVRASSGVRFGILVGIDQAQVLLKDRPAGYDIPDLGSASPAIPSSRTLNRRSDTDGIGTLSTITIGGVTSLGLENLRVGAMASFPLVGAGGNASRFADERERLFSNQLEFDVVGARTRNFDIELGLAYEVLPGLSIGLGGALIPVVTLQNDVYVRNPTDQAVVDINLRQDQTFDWGFSGGLLYEFREQLRLGIAYRQALAFDIGGRNALQILGLDVDDADYPVIQEVNWIPAGTPAAAAFGVAFDFEELTVAVDVRYTLWSDFKDTQARNAGWNDVFTPRVGIEYAAGPNVDLRLGLAYEPSPVPDQTGRTNYVDNDRVLGSLGSVYRFELAERNLAIGWFVQFQGMLSRDTDKEELLAWPACSDAVRSVCDEVPDDLRDPRTGASFPGAIGLQTENPGFPGFVSGGWLGAIGVDLDWTF